MFAALGTKVTVVERRDRILEFCDLEVVEALKYHLRVLADTVMYSAGRQGMTGELGLEAAGLTADERGRIAVDAYFRTQCRTSTRSATSSGSPRWPPRPWSRAGWPPSTRA